MTAKILYADATPHLPDLPADFWTAFPGNTADISVWTPIASAQTVNVNDGRLTLSNASGASNNKICFVQITTAAANPPGEQPYPTLPSVPSDTIEAENFQTVLIERKEDIWPSFKAFLAKDRGAETATA